jgi:autotransporter-associated beta strand protein
MAHGNNDLPNLFTGPTVITNGVLKVNNPRVLGPVTAGTIFATNGGTFDLNGQAMGLKAVTMQGAGFNGQGAVVNNGALQTLALQILTMTGDATVGGIQRFDLRGNPWDTFLNTGGQPYRLTKVGPQAFSLVSATIDPAFGDVDVQQGTFSFEVNSTTLGDPGKTVTVAPNATFQLWAATNLVNKQFVLNGGSTPSVFVSSGSNTILGPFTLNADSTFNITGTSLALYGAVGGAGGFIKIGSNPLFLYGANTYLGNTVINAGTVALGPSASLAASPLINVASGAVLNVSAMPSGLSLGNNQTLMGSGSVHGSLTAPTGSTLIPGSNPGTLTITNLLTLNNASATFELGADALTAAASDRIVAGQLAASGITTLKLIPLGILNTVNPYTLITNLGTALPVGSETNFAVTSPSRYSFSVVPTDSSAGKAVQVQVSSGALAGLVWQGNDATNPTLWDTKVTSNWLNGTTSDTFFAGDIVVFNDSAVGTTAELIGTIQPSLILLSNISKSITIGGAGKLTAASLSNDKTGTTTIANTAANTFVYGITNNSGTLVIANSADNALGPIALNSGTLKFDQPLDTTVGSAITGGGLLVKDGAKVLTLNGNSPAFNGTIQVNSGILRAGVVGALGSIAAGTTIAAGATLDVNAINLTNEVVAVSGPGVGGLGAIVNNSGTGQNNALHDVTLTGDTTFSGVGRWDIRTNSTSPGNLLSGGNAYNLTKVGGNMVSVVSSFVDTALGNIDVQQGGFNYEGSTTSLGDPTKTLNVASNAYFLMYGATKPLNKQVRLPGGALMQSQSVSNTIWGPIALPGGMAAIQTDVNLTVTNQISGPGILQKIGTATLFLNTSNNLSASIFVTNGTLSNSHPDALGSSGTVFIRRGSVTGGSGTKLSLRGGITTQATTAAHFTTTSVGGDYRCSMSSDAGGANTWAGPIQLNGETSVGFYGAAGAPLIINGPTYGTNGYTGQAFYRGAGPVTINGQVILPTGRFTVTDNSLVTVNSVGNVWVTTLSAFGRLLVGANNALCPTANLILGQAGSAAFLDLGGWTQAIGSLATAGTAASQTIGSSSTTADSKLIFDGTTNVSTYAGNIVDSVAGGTMKVALTVTSGALYLNAATSYTGPTSVEGGAFGGTGSLLSPVTVLAGGTLAPGPSIGTLTVANTVNLGGTTLMEVSKTDATITNDLLRGVTTLAYGGTLVVSNLADPLYRSA